MAHKLKACVKTHKENEPVRLIVNNIQEPSYKIATYLNKRLNNFVCLPYTCNTKNLLEIAQELKQYSNQQTQQNNHP
jgi:5,10-methylenetetrahydrofolate reductase